MIVARFRGACLKFMNDFTATSPIAARHKRASRAISRERERNQQREGCMAHIRDYTSAENRQKTGERERERERGGGDGGRREEGWGSHPTKYINCRIFRASCTSVRAPLCPLPGADLLIINYFDHQVHPFPAHFSLPPPPPPPPILSGDC